MDETGVTTTTSEEEVVRLVPDDMLEPLTDLWEEAEEDRGSVGRTMFDSSASKDNTLTVLLPKETLNKVPAQSLIRIESRSDDRTYLAIVTAGPFAEPDGLRADAPAIVTTSVRGGIFMPRYHGRV